MHRNLLAFGTLCALVGIALGSRMHPWPGPLDVVALASPAAQEPAASAAPLTAEEEINIAVYDNVNQSVVHIMTRSIRPDLWYTDVMPTEGSGSGSVLDKQGHILTNYHVIEGAQQIQVALASGKAYVARLVGQDPTNDIAVLRIDAPADQLSPITMGDSSTLRVGQKIYAIGNPFGLERTLTVGIISSLNRTLMSRNKRTIKSIIQIDAALNRGNSGGPLLDSHSHFIGMNTAIASSTGENTGIGFAIAVNTIHRVVPQLIEFGQVTRPDLGIARAFERGDGLLIAALSPEGPAERAGLQGFRLVRTRKRQGPYIVEQTQLDQSQADLIIGIDGKRIRTVDDMLSMIEQKKPGDKVLVSVLRGGEQLDLEVTLGAAE